MPRQSQPPVTKPQPAGRGSGHLTLRQPAEADLPALAALWHDAWHEAHAAHVPAALLERRTLDSFRKRLAKTLPACRMAEDTEGPLGFCQINTRPPGELDQLFLALRARGSGLAGQLLSDAEARLAAAGCLCPVLYCLPENTHARRFYERQGWQDTGIRTVQLRTVTGSFPLPTTVFEKTLAP